MPKLPNVDRAYPEDLQAFPDRPTAHTMGITRQMLEDAQQESIWAPETATGQLNRLRPVAPDIDPNMTTQGPNDTSQAGTFTKPLWTYPTGDRSA